jgi:hypothetical protein
MCFNVGRYQFRQPFKVKLLYCTHFVMLIIPPSEYAVACDYFLMQNNHLPAGISCFRWTVVRMARKEEISLDILISIITST